MAIFVSLIYKNFPGGRIEKQSRLRINQDITSSQVRLIGLDGQQIGVTSLTDALKKAEDINMDLVEISPDANPVVCKILDYGKYKYRESKKRQESKAKQKQVEIKEIKFRLATGEGDYTVKLRNAIRFLESGNRVKALIAFRGREISKQDLGKLRLARFTQDLQHVADVERGPILEGNRLNMFFTPKAKDKRK